MKHIEDQNLLLLAHGSLDPSQWLSAKLHLMRCADCKRRYAEATSLSSSVASAVRIGLPVWQPAGMALQVKLLIAAIIVAGSLLGIEIVMISSDSTGASRNSAKDVDAKYLDFSSTTNPTKRAALDALKKSRGEPPAVYKDVPTHGPNPGGN